MNEVNLLLVLLGIVLFALFSAPISRGNLTPPMAFAALGLLLSPIGLDLIYLELDNKVIHIVAEITLILVLFTDAARINLKNLWADHDIPLRLLFIGMPLTIVAGALIAKMILPELLFIEALILAVILAPTDAALGQVVVSSPKVPERIRQSLNVESGLNDGIALPVLLFVISFAVSRYEGKHDTNWIYFIIQQVTLGPLAGIIIGWLGALAINKAIERKFLTHEFCNIYLLALAFVAFLASELIGGNGFIAAFTAGMALGNKLKHANEEIYEFAESEGQLLNLIIFFIFGVALLPKVWDQVNWDIIAYALLSLTLVRMIPVFLSLIGKHLRWETTLFLGWFGPRGLASILFILLVLDQTQLAHESLIFNTVIVTVTFSILLHGLTASPSVNAYVAALNICKRRGKDLSPEHRSVAAMPLRHTPKS